MMALLAATAAAFALFATLLLRMLVRVIRRRFAQPGGPGLPHLLFRDPAFSADRRALALTAITMVTLGAVFAIKAGLFP